ncbi:MAG: ABC transporter ATP-binding protein [Vicinamibacterales bacterium]|nr:ABC transporter ATP-binding protein [Vicinamibacterales bacterium]
MNAIEVRDLRKSYRRFSQRRQFSTLKSALLSGSVAKALKPDESLEALKGVSFNVQAGRSFGVIGRNGSGKSTLLKLLAGIGKPSGGTISVAGRVSALIELGAGFHPEISGRENVFINGLMLGLSRKEIGQRFDAIVSFAGLEDFIDAPVKTYSSGMYMRLGFAVATHVDPDVLLVDEVLAVGDEAFTHKCLDTFAEFRRRGRTVVLVTHSLDLVDRFCDEALWLDDGLVRAQGDPRRIVDEYRLDVARVENRELTQGNQTALERVAESSPPVESPSAAPSSAPHSVPSTGEVAAEGEAAAPEAEPESEPADLFKATEGRWGSREAEITGVEVLGADGHPATVLESGGTLGLRLTVTAAQPLTDVVFGIGVFNADGTCCYGTNTLIDGEPDRTLEGTAEVRLEIHPLDLVAGSYKLDVAVHRANGTPYDYHRLLYSFRVTSAIPDVGISRLHHRWHFSGAIRGVVRP